jgi:phosphate transport system substrate-binding protein
MATVGFAQNQSSNWSGVSINGAGATFPMPIYSQWAYDYENAAGLKVNYQSVGSGAGIAAIESKTVDFGASDAPLTTDDLTKYGLTQFPMIIGGVVPVVNIPGLQAGQLRLTGELLADIYIGNITNWSDEKIKSVNPDINLPEKAIVVVHRADGSGTTWIFTNYLDAVSSQWHDSVGIGKSVEWPSTGVGGRGNEGVASYVGQVDGAIGYVEYAYAVQNHLTYAQMQNRAGNFVPPTADAFAAAASNADWANAPGYYMVLVNQPGDQSWPITGASFIIMYQDQANQRTARAILEFFDWSYRNGQDAAMSLDYVPIPMNVVEMVENTWHANISSGGQAVW